MDNFHLSTWYQTTGTTKSAHLSSSEPWFGILDSSGVAYQVRLQLGLSIRPNHTAFFGTPEPEKQFETPIRFLSRPSLLEHPFYSLLQGVDEVVSTYLFLHWIMVLWLITAPSSGQPRLWEGSWFSHHRPIQE
ncbi:hypothetical protein AVEN_141651-1 [Araneus ventricosus]|uniref:Uncharacterized protein n=1 Tax=Araneus ventricosus TaxID=182803 RepID=A0A4Y2ITD2_ARAVE|nr:hypothetical protein AVEN_141651-1 [Araneus ventricosus]